MGIQKLLAFLVVMCLSLSLRAQHNITVDSVLDHFTGRWLLTGFMAGKQVKHDIYAGWVLGHEYFR